jgi:hypothetical protein
MIESVRQPERLSFTVFVWDEVLKFARLYGWKPAGTLPPDEADAEERAAWGGNYVTNGGQSVSPNDARALGEALSQGLSDLPDHYCAVRKIGDSPSRTAQSGGESNEGRRPLSVGSVGRAEPLPRVLCKGEGLPRERSSAGNGVAILPRCVVCGGAQDDFGRGGGAPHAPRAGRGTDLAYRGPERREQSGGGGANRVLPPRRLRDLVSRRATSPPVSRRACARRVLHPVADCNQGDPQRRGESHRLAHPPRRSVTFRDLAYLATECTHNRVVPASWSEVSSPQPAIPGNGSPLKYPSIRGRTRLPVSSSFEEPDLLCARG